MTFLKYLYKHPLVGMLIFFIIIYLPALQYGYLSYDDQGFFIKNPYVNQGFTKQGILWAVTGRDPASLVADGVSNLWHPITWLSYMAESALFGTKAPISHAIHIILYALTACGLYLLYKLLFQPTHKEFKSISLWLVLIFLIHPQHSESILWIAERKGILANLFGIWFLYFYLKNSGRLTAGSLLLYSAALLSKPSMVVLPAIALLLEAFTQYKNKGNLDLKALIRPTQNKLILWLGATLVAIKTISLQQSGTKALETSLSIAEKATNTLSKTGEYLWRSIAPHDLSYYYSLPPRSHLYTNIAIFLITALAVFIIIKKSNWLSKQKRITFTLGFSWFLVSLIPVLGIIHLSPSFINDRYSIFPHIGLFMSLAIVIFQISKKYAHFVMASFCIILLALNLKQMSRWQNSENLYKSAIEAQPNAAQPKVNLAIIKLQQHKPNQAKELFHEAIRVNPSDHLAYFNLGKIALQQSSFTEAQSHLEKSLEIAPSFTPPNYFLSLCHASPENLDRDPEISLQYIQKAIEHSSKPNPRYQKLKRYLIQELE